MTLSLLGGIHHVAIIASDYERSRHFYHQVLGLPILAETLREARQSWKLDLALASSKASGKGRPSWTNVTASMPPSMMNSPWAKLITWLAL